MASAVTLPILAALARQSAEGDKQAKAALRKVTEHDFQVAVTQYAEARGWLTGYIKRSGYVGKDGTWKGMGPRGEPDVRLARGGVYLTRELKTESGTLSEEQKRWQDALGPYGGVWRPRDSAEIMEVLQ